MGNNNEIRVVLGSLRYKSASNTTIGLKLPLIQTAKENIEFDRNINISLAEVFDRERQKSTIFRPTCKFSLLFKNSYTGSTNYVPFENNLYYVNASTAAKNQCDQSAENVSWSGLPQYNEFDFIRNDYNVVGYTQPPNNHITFVNQSASTYNWNFFLSYPYDNDYTKNMSALDRVYNNSLNWKSGDGLPFSITMTSENGTNVVRFTCPAKHGLSVGEYVKLSFKYNNDEYFEVYSLGDGRVNSEKYIFNIVNYGFVGSTFSDGVSGTFKRVLDINNPTNSTSEYYVKRNKLISNVEDAVLVNAGFEQNIFGKVKKYESSGFTPNYVERTSIKEGAQSYTVTFNTDFDISPLRDNQKRPITELYFTVIWKGYFGWMFGTVGSGLQQGYEWNLPLNGNSPNPWWSNTNNDSKTGFPLGNYSTPMGSAQTGLFTYVKSLKYGDIVDGDYCEWNDLEQTERTISTLYHKFKFNPKVFNIRGNTVSTDNLFGYYYQPHHKLTTRVYSDYVESADPSVIDIPDYSFFNTTQQEFIWRDIYTYGYFDSDGRGVDYPFLNGKHYPTMNSIFRIIPEGTNYVSDNIVPEPTIDECE